jgi:photosystem II stability/assembly factor-like uncharacterized protein
VQLNLPETTLAPGRDHVLARLPSGTHRSGRLDVREAAVSDGGFDVPATVENTSENVVVETTDWAGRADVIRRDDGVFLLTYRRGTHHGNVADATLHLHFSADEGRTWGPPNETPDGDPVEGFPYDIADRSMGYGVVERTQDGNLLVVVGRKRTDSQALDGTGILRSADGGETWTDEGKVTFAGHEGDDDGCYTSDTFCHPETGDLYLSLFYLPDNDPDEIPAYALARSSDGGRSWTFVGHITDVPGGDPAGGESAIEYLGGERLLCVGRTFDDSATVVYESEDRGETWTGPRDIGDQVGIVNKPRLYTEGAITDGLGYTAGALFLCGRERVVSRAAAQGEHNMVAASTDGGETWTRPAKGADYGDGGYSGLTRRSDGTLYQVGYGGAGNVYPCDVLDLTYEFTPELAVEVRDDDTGETLYSGHAGHEAGDPLATLDVAGRNLVVAVVNRSARELDATARLALAYRG